MYVLGLQLCNRFEAKNLDLSMKFKNDGGYHFKHHLAYSVKYESSRDLYYK